MRWRSYKYELREAFLNPWISDSPKNTSSFVKPFERSPKPKCCPTLWKWDESQHFPVEIFRKLGDLGVLGAVFPEELGGSGYSYVDYSILVEELARVDPSIALSIAAHISLCSNHIYLAGDDGQRRKYIPKLASGELIGAWALTEPESGSDAGGTRTAAVRQGDFWVLNGSKTFITNAHIADVFVVMAMTDRAQATHGISAILVDKGTQGFRTGKKENKLGMRCSPTGELIFTGLPRARREPDRQARRGVYRQPSCARWRSNFDCGVERRDRAEAQLTKRPSNIPSSASSSGGSSPNFRRSRTSWRTWLRKSMRRDC